MPIRVQCSRNAILDLRVVAVGGFVLLLRKIYTHTRCSLKVAENRKKPNCTKFWCAFAKGNALRNSGVASVHEIAVKFNSGACLGVQEVVFMFSSVHCWLNYFVGNSCTLGLFNYRFQTCGKLHEKHQFFTLISMACGILTSPGINWRAPPSCCLD